MTAKMMAHFNMTTTPRKFVESDVSRGVVVLV